jgi:tetratricopeptide (TPR) repeat protein
VIGIGVVAAAVVAVIVFLFPKGPLRPEDILAGMQDGAPYSGLTVRYPLDETVFPPEIVPPTFRWEDGQSGSDAWLVTIAFQDEEGPLHFLSLAPEWTPDAGDWEAIKKRSLERAATVTVVGVNRSAPGRILSGGRVTMSTSKDEVGAPLFYREVNLPFIDAVKDPSHIRWRFGAISSPRPPVVLENLPVCGNCHSFCAKGETLAMDVDYANSKGSYVITRVAREMVLATSDIITWNDYAREDGEQTFGLLSQISPDGNAVVSTVKDKSVFVPKPDLEFSQLFFPIKGILCIFNRQTNTFQPLPGADDPRYVQSNPTWSPDGKSIVFARAEAYELKDTRGKDKVLLTREDCREFLEDGKPFRFDLYRIPFNGGRGGEPEPLQGASHNGVSNFFARYSPDGRWIVFCKARSYMLLQPDSELYIMPSEGGKPRRLRCNTRRMNSWHSWSPNGRWLVFASKAHSAYTQLFLTHIDDRGRSTPAVVLSHLTAPDRAANIPEFVNTAPSAIRKMDERFLDDYSYVRAGNAFFRAGDADNAIEEYRNALQRNPGNAEAHRKLGFLLYNVKKVHNDGMTHYEKAMSLAPNDPRIHYDLGMALSHQKQYGRAVRHISRALRQMPHGHDDQYNLTDMHYNLGMALCYNRQFQESAVHLSEAVRLDPNSAKRHYGLALALAAGGKIDETLTHYSKAVSLRPDVDRSPTLHRRLAMNFAKAGRFDQAASSAERALYLARASGNQDFARQIEQELQFYRQNLTRPRP